MGAFGGTTKAKSELVGVTPAMMQTITDAAYADFVSRLQASGYTVQTPADLFGHAALGKSKSQDVPLDINIALEKGSKGKATYFKPSDLPSLLMIPGDFLGSGMSSIGINMAAGQTGMAFANYAKQAGVGVIDVVYLIDFSNQKRPGAFSFGGIQVNSGLSVAADYSRLTLIAPSGKQSVITVKAPVAVEGDFIERTMRPAARTRRCNRAPTSRAASRRSPGWAACASARRASSNSRQSPAPMKRVRPRRQAWRARC